jgi:pimeloyl-ACP methyl ester carboxylesterase
MDAAAAPIVEGQYVEASPGVRLHYASCGDPAKPLMLLLHGFPEFWGAWREIMPALAKRHHVVAPDLRGYNLSDKPPEVSDYRAPLLVADVVGLVRALGYEHCVLVAHDWGGAVAWAVSIAHPELVQRLVIVNAPHPVLFARALANDSAQQAASQYMNWLRKPGSEDRLAENDYVRIEGMLLKSGGEAWLKGATRDAYRSAWRQPGALAASVNWYRASPLRPPSADDPGSGTLQLDASAFVVQVPTLVLWGERDPALLPVLLEGLDLFVPVLEVVRLADATHWVVHEHPERVVAEIERFTTYGA